ncbi:MAG TPA: hypothetical protein VKA84_03850, partial [Gemmatimonadaceae bacterium]|nr:hypothetical protein [Gemmatimonadaceae bacterium]
MTPTNTTSGGGTGMSYEQAIESKGYAHPEALVTTEWLAAHLHDPALRVLESDEDVLLYDL